MLSCYGKQRLGVLIKLCFAICRMHKGNHGKHHALVSCSQVVKKFLHLLALLFHIVRHGGGKIVVLILLPLPVCDVRRHTEQSALRFTHRLVGGNRNNINRHHQIAVKVSKLCHHIVLDKRRILAQEKHPCVAVADFQIVLFKLHRVGADIVLEIVPFPAGFPDVKTERAFLADPIKVMENSQAFIGFKLGAFTSEPAEVGNQVCADAGKIASCFLNIFLADRDSNILVLHDGVSAGRLFEQNFVVFLTVDIEFVTFKREQNGFLKINAVKPAVIDCDFGCRSAVKRVEQLGVFKEHCFLVLTACYRIVNIRKLKGLGEFVFPDLENTVVIYSLDRNDVLYALWHYELLLFLFK